MDGDSREFQKIRRHQVFWDLETTDRPLAGIYLGSFMRQDIYAAAGEGEILSPGQLTAQTFRDGLSLESEVLNSLPHDLIFPAQVISSVPWLEAMLGCQVRVQSQSVWAERVLKKDQPIGDFSPQWCPAWLENAVTFTRDLVKHFHPQLPVAGPFLRGPADVVAALIGTDRLCIEVIDHPDEVHRLCQVAAQAWIRASQEIIRLIPPWHGGYVLGARWLWAPGPSTYSSEDITCILSNRVYREIFLPYDQFTASQFPYGFMHRHSPSAHSIGSLHALPAGWAVEVTMDESGPRASQVLPVLQRVQEAGRPLIVFGLSDPDEISRLLEGLSPRGLCLTAHAETENDAVPLLRAIRREIPHAWSVG